MIGLKPAVGLFCALLSTSMSTFAAPAHISQEDIATHVQLSERGAGFNPRQKWQRDEINCIQILNPAPGANYHPGWFVRMNFGAAQCQGVTAAGPWTIHLYNNPEIQQSGGIRFDYHEVIADGLSEYKTQYLWNIPADQTTKARNVKKVNDYYVRVETNSHEGIKLVGNVGPFAITADNAVARLRSLTQEIQQVKRREDQLQVPSKTQPEQRPDGNLHAEFALRPKPVVVQTPNVDKDGTPLPTKDESGQATNSEAPVVSEDPVVAPTTPESPAIAPEAPMNPVVTPEVPVTPAMPIVDPTPDPVATTPVLPASNDDTNGVPEPHNLPPSPDGLQDVVSDPDAPLPHNLPPAPAYTNLVPVTPISHGSLIPNGALIGGSVLAGAIGLGYLGSAGLGQLGAVLGAVLGGVVGGVAAVLSLVGVPV